MAQNQHDFDYDLIVIGCGPAGQRAAIQAAKVRKKVAIIDRREVVGGSASILGRFPASHLRKRVSSFQGFASGASMELDIA